MRRIGVAVRWNAYQVDHPRKGGEIDSRGILAPNLTY